MTITRLFSVLVFLFVSIPLLAQKKKIMGVVQDTTSNPFEFANIIAHYEGTGKVASLGVSDYQGRFVLYLEPGNNYELKASFIGYETTTLKLYPDTLTEDLKIVLKESATQLNAIEVTSEFPVVITDDTISYKADAFTDGNERKLKDVLEDLPGFEVDENGDVKVQGKKVEKVLVDGKEFFDGDPRMATKNLPANAVDKVQLLRDYNDVQPMNGLNSEERYALNIKLKEGKERMVFGDVEARVGPKSRYFGHANMFYYDPKLNVNFIGNANNIGEPAFSARDYFRFSGGFRGLNNRSGGSINISENNSGISFQDSRSAVEVESHLEALNFTYTPNKKWRISGFGILNGVKSDNRSLSSRRFIRENGESREELENETSQETFSGLIKLSGSYTPGAALHMTANSFAKFSHFNTLSTLNSRFDRLENEINSAFDQRPLNVKQDLSAYYAPNQKDVWSFENQFEYKFEDPQLLLNSDRALFTGLLNRRDLVQQQQTASYKYESQLNYYRVLNLTNHVNFTTGIEHLNQQFETSILASNLMEENSLAFSLVDAYVGAGFKSKLGDFVIFPQLMAHRFSLMTDEQIEIKALFTPRLSIDYDITSSQSIAIDFDVNAQYFDAANYAPQLVIQNYNLLKRGNPALNNAIYQSLNLAYRNFNMFSFFNLFGGVNYNRRIDDLSNEIDFEGAERVATIVNLPNVNETLTGYANFSKRFRKFRIKSDVRLNSSQFGNFIEGELTQNRAFTQQYSLGFETKILNAVILDLKYNTVINDYSGQNISSTFITSNPTIGIDIRFLSNFTFESTYEFFDYRDAGNTINTTYDFLTSSLFFQKADSPWQFKIDGMNMLNTKSIRRDSFSDNMIATQLQFIQPFYWTLGVKYEL